MMDTASDSAKQYGEELCKPKPDKTLIEHLQGASATQFNCIVQRGGQLLNVREYLDKYAFNRLGCQVSELVHAALDKCVTVPARNSSASSSGAQPGLSVHFSPFQSSDEEIATHDGYSQLAGSEAPSMQIQEQVMPLDVPDIPELPVLPVRTPSEQASLREQLGSMYVEPPQYSASADPSVPASEPPYSACLEPPMSASVEPPGSASAEPPISASVEPPSSASVEPPGSASAEPPMSASVETPTISASVEPWVSAPVEPQVSASVAPCVLPSVEPPASALEPSTVIDLTNPTVGEARPGEVAVVDAPRYTYERASYDECAETLPGYDPCAETLRDTPSQ